MGATAVRMDKRIVSVVQGIAGANKQGNRAEAVRLAEAAAVAFPDFDLSAFGRDNMSGSFADLAAKMRGVSASASVKAAPVSEPVSLVKAPKPETTVLRLVHDGVAPTSLFGVPKDSEAHRIIGAKRNGGLGWMWWGGTQAFYIRKSKGYAADMARITEAVEALEAAREAGVQLYRVDQEIATTLPSGEALPVYESVADKRARRAEWQREYTGRLNSAKWELGIGTAACSTCSRTGLDVRTGRTTQDDANLPWVQCVTCTGEAEPVAVPEVSGLTLALDMIAAELPLSAECPSCRQLVEVKDGKLALHMKPYASTACRGKLGVAKAADVEPEPAAAAPVKPARKARTVKATAPAPVSAVVDTSDLQVLMSAALMAGDQAEAARVFQAMSERATAAREAAELAQELLADLPAASEAGPSVEVIGTAWKFATVTGISGSTLKRSATEARSDLARALHAKFRGTRVQIERDKDAKVLVATVTAAPEMDAKQARELAKLVRDVVSSQRGMTTAAKVAA